MSLLPQALEHLIAELGKLPGIGRRGAERIAFVLLDRGPETARALAGAAAALHEEIGLCPRCGYFSERGQCPVCSDRTRDEGVLCVVETPLDVVAFERSAGFRGRYHVLGGVLSPLKGVTPDDLSIDALDDRLTATPVAELILATSPSVEGDATAVYLQQQLAREGMVISRIGRGVPMGGSLELIDAGTLRMALEGRRQV